MEFATAAATIVGQKPNPQWATVSAALVFLFNETAQLHWEYANYTLGEKIKQADVVLLGFPLMMNMSKQIRRNDLEYYAKVTDGLAPFFSFFLSVNFASRNFFVTSSCLSCEQRMALP